MIYQVSSNDDHLTYTFIGWPHNTYIYIFVYGIHHYIGWLRLLACSYDIGCLPVWGSHQHWRPQLSELRPIYKNIGLQYQQLYAPSPPAVCCSVKYAGTCLCWMSNVWICGVRCIWNHNPRAATLESLFLTPIYLILKSYLNLTDQVRTRYQNWDASFNVYRPPNGHHYHTFITN